MKTVTVVLNGFKRQKTLPAQITALKNQTYKIDRIMYWNLKSDKPEFQPDYALLKKEGIEYAETSHDYGVWGRFTFALNTNTDFICMMDDDVIPGPGYIQNCMETYEKQPGILGMMGTVIVEENRKWMQYGWRDLNNRKPVQVMYLYQSHFFPRNVLQAFWSELPNWEIVCNRRIGEDMHIAYVAQKYFKLNTYVVPHPKDNKNIWGNIIGDTFGEDEHAVHLSHNKNMLTYLNFLIKKANYKIPTFKTMKDAYEHGE
jgi:hypothetical protein